MGLDIFYFLLIALAINITLFVIVLRTQTDKLIDISYALSFVTLAVYGLAFYGMNPVKAIASIMVLFWATRLGTFLFIRTQRRGKDTRFDELRGDVTRFGTFWISQAVVVWVILLPVILLFLHAEPIFTKFSLIGVSIWGLGLGVEAIADLQKYRFRGVPSNKGKWIESGIWSYSRHPNYFGEMLVWMGLYMYVFPILTMWQAIIALASPLCVVLLLRFVSGVPLLEQRADARWGKNRDYLDYKKRTSLLIPLPPKLPWQPL